MINPSAFLKASGKKPLEVLIPDFFFFFFFKDTGSYSSLSLWARVDGQASQQLCLVLPSVFVT